MIRAGNYDTAFDDVEVVSPGDVWAVGNTGGKAITEHWDGASWSAVAGVNLFDEQNLDDVLSLPGGRLWTVGNNRFATVSCSNSSPRLPSSTAPGPRRSRSPGRSAVRSRGASPARITGSTR